MTIRLATPNDADAIATIYDPIVRETTISFEEAPPTASEMTLRIEDCLKVHPWLVAEDGGILGFAYASQHRRRAAYRWSADVSVYVCEAARRQGVARALYEGLFRLLKLQGFQSAFACVALPNDASIAFHRSCGFELIGIYKKVGYKFGAWRDTSWWQRALNADGPPAGDPVPLESMDATFVRAELAR